MAVQKAEYTISDAEIASTHVEAAPTVLQGTVTENKRVFDAMPAMIAKKHNALARHVDEDFSSYAIAPAVLGMYSEMGWDGDD